MAIFHASLRVFSRAKGQSAVAAAAYRMGSSLRDERTGEWHNYSRKPGVVSVHFHAPAIAPPWTTNAQELWSRVEQRETRANAAVARELIVALPNELPAEQRATLACSIAEWLVERYGVAVMTAIHAPDGKGDQRNSHAHLLMTTRRVDAAGLVGKVRVLDDRATGKVEVRAIRELVADRTNAALWRHGETARVDHRSLDEQTSEALARADLDRAMRLMREPTRHEGQKVTAQKRRGNIMAGARRNRRIRISNAQRRVALSRQIGPLARVAKARRPYVPFHSGERGVQTQAQGRDAHLLNAQRQDLEASLRADAEFAEAFNRMLSQSNLGIVNGQIQPLPSKLTQRAKRAAKTASHPKRAAGQIPREVRSTHFEGSSSAKQNGKDQVAHRTRREWAEFRRRQPQSGVRQSSKAVQARKRGP